MWGQLHGTTVAQALRAVLRREGVRGLYGGVWAVSLGAGCGPVLTARARSPLVCSSHAAALPCRPAHALYFAAYEAAKEALGGSREGHHPFAVAAAGVFATLTSDACMTPFDVVKQRLQVRCACQPSTCSLLR